jgi:hypothetical protein
VWEVKFISSFQEVKVMQANQLTIKSYPSIAPVPGSLMSENLHMTVKGWLCRLIGCWHLELSRPFSSEGKGYRVCLNCGAQRQFNLKSWEMQGDFYYRRASTKPLRAVSSLAAVRRVAA